MIYWILTGYSFLPFLSTAHAHNFLNLLKWELPSRWHIHHVACLLAQSLQLGPTLCNPIDCSLPGSSVHRISPGKNIGVGCHSLLHGIFPIQGQNLGLPHCWQNRYHLSHRESPQEIHLECLFKTSDLSGFIWNTTVLNNIKLTNSSLTMWLSTAFWSILWIRQMATADS